MGWADDRGKTPSVTRLPDATPPGYISPATVPEAVCPSSPAAWPAPALGLPPQSVSCGHGDPGRRAGADDGLTQRGPGLGARLSPPETTADYKKFLVSAHPGAFARLLLYYLPPCAPPGPLTHSLSPQLLGGVSLPVWAELAFTPHASLPISPISRGGLLPRGSLDFAFHVLY